MVFIFSCCFFEVNALCISSAAVFGASGGVGQLICQKLSQQGVYTTAVTRNKQSALQFEPLAKVNSIIEADARVVDDRLRLACSAEAIVISLGTTAFPTKKWEGGASNPQIACVQTVRNIMGVIRELRSCKSARTEDPVPRRVVLLSSIGVDRSDVMPFKLLNSFGVLDAKRESEQEVLLESANMDLESAIVVRPGRLVGGLSLASTCFHLFSLADFVLN